MRLVKLRIPWVTILCFTIVLASDDFDDNELLENPEILCNADTIDMQFKTRRQFNGKVYVKGNYNRPECRVDYSKKTEDGRPIGGIRLNHGACNMDRQRMITPDGLMFSTVLIISFHPLFITKMDKAYHIKCMYREAVRTVTASIDVSMLPTESVLSDLPMPTCEYTIRKDSLDGPVLKYARVGDQVVHRWQCDSEEYGVLVHSCYVEDGQGEKQLIVDDKGCHTDRLLLGDPTYVEALNMAYRESFVFKFADRVAVRFQCEIRLCLKEDGGCDGITPPLCFDANHVHVSDKDHYTPNDTAAIVKRERRSTSFSKSADLFSQTVYVLDSDNENNKTETEALESFSSSGGYCFGAQAIVSIVTAFSAVILLLVSVIVFIAYRFYQSESRTAVRKSESTYY